MKIFFSVVFLLIIINARSQESETSVFYSNRGTDLKWMSYQDPEHTLYKLISNEAYRLLDKRAAKINSLATKEDWEVYQKNSHLKLFPATHLFEKCSLNAQITDVVHKENFTVEKIIFESHQGFYTTSALFIPKNLKEPAPAIIYCSGHSADGFRSEVYQHVILNLVQKGFVVFAFDPIGQGERLQYPNPETGKSNIGGPTSEHTFAGIQTLLNGVSLADYFVWDGVRAIDYLETRKEVDASRIGITGRSGGGTQSAMIAAFDKRIKAAAPECYITSFKRLLQSIGPQDAEQNPSGFIADGFDHADFLHLRAPEPTLIITTTHDFFSQQGARETFAEAQRSHLAFGKPENIAFCEDFAEHESTRLNRERMYAFFQKHLLLPGDSTDMEISLLTPDELQVTKTGQVGTSLKGKTVFNLNLQYAWKKNSEETDVKLQLKELSGAEFNRKYTTAVFTGKIIKENLVIRKYFLENDKNDIALPFYVINKKEKQPGKILLWINEKGKQAVLNSILLKDLTEKNYTIIAVDLPGIGELKDPEFKGDGFVKNVAFNYTFGASLIGKSIPGIQCESVDLILQYIGKEYSGQKIDAVNNGTQSLLYYAVLNPTFRKLIITDVPKNYKDLTNSIYFDPLKAFYMIPGSVPCFDMDDLIKCAGQVKVKTYFDDLSIDTSNKYIEFMRFLEYRP